MKDLTEKDLHDIARKALNALAYYSENPVSATRQASERAEADLYKALVSVIKERDEARQAVTDDLAMEALEQRLSDMLRRRDAST